MLTYQCEIMISQKFWRSSLGWTHSTTQTNLNIMEWHSIY